MTHTRIWLAPAVVLAATLSSAFAQTTPAWTPAALDAMRRLQAAALRDEYGYQRLAHLTDTIGPRPVGSTQAAAAVEYVAAELRQLGFEVRLEKVRVPRWVRGEDRAEIVAYSGQGRGITQRLVVAALGGTEVSTPGAGVTAGVVIVDDYAELSALPREKVAGKIVLFNRRFDGRKAAAGAAGGAYEEAVEFRNSGRMAAAKAGAAAVLVRSVGGADFRIVHAGATDYFNQSRIPAATITAEDADLVARLSAQGPVQLHLALASDLHEDVDSYNVIADLKGSAHPEQVVIVSGHLDSWDLGTGALDDAAGVAIAMSAAHLLHEQNLRPERTIRVVAWMGEELGLLGARAYGKEHAAEMANHFAAIETDSGAGHPIGIYCTGDRALADLLQPVADILRASGAGVVQDLKDSAPDLIPLHYRGVPAFQPFQDVRTYFDYHHTPADTLDKVDGQALRENIASVTVLAYALGTIQRDLPREQVALPEWLK